MLKRNFIRHVVFFSAKNAADVGRIYDGLNILAGIPHSKNFEVSENTRCDDISKEVDVIVYAEFDSQADLNAYKSHPLYQKAIDIVRPLRDIRMAADF